MDLSSSLPEPRAVPAQPLPSGAAAPPAHASLLESLAVLLDVLLPTIAKGVIVRRPWVTALAERLQLDRRAIRRLQKLRARHGGRALLVRLDRPRLVVLDGADVHRVLEGTPEPFATDSFEKHSALSQMQPRGSLISRGAERTQRRQLNEQALQSGSARHALAARFDALVQQEADALLADVGARGELGWPAFSGVWGRLVRRVVLGEAARGDEGIAALMTRLRGRANWGFVAPHDPRLTGELLERIRAYLRQGDAAESLAGFLASRAQGPDAAPEHQVPQWLFAFDPAGMATLRALALLATHPETAAAVRGELAAGAPERPLLRSVVLESLRLWPTTPMVLRETTGPTPWGGETLPAGTGVLVFTPFFHRDGERLACADRLAPQNWLSPRSTGDWPLVPFSSGPATCPARHLVLHLASGFLARLLAAGDWRLLAPAGLLSPAQPLPATLNHAGLRFSLVS